MRKSELKVGGEYAAGSSSRFGRWQLVPVRVVEIDGERPRPNGTVQRGIVVQLLEDTYDYRWRGKAGDEKVIDSARDLQCEWAPYVERKAEQKQKEQAREAERARRFNVVDDTLIRLRTLGIDVEDGIRRNLSTGALSVEPDAMAKIVALIPGGR